MYCYLVFNHSKKWVAIIGDYNVTSVVVVVFVNRIKRGDVYAFLCGRFSFSLFFFLNTCRIITLVTNLQREKSMFKRKNEYYFSNKKATTKNHLT